MVFTGLVEGMGAVVDASDIAAGRRLTVNLSNLDGETTLGESIAINGCCLTVVSQTSDAADFEVGPETLARTNLGTLAVGDMVNLERSLAVGARLGGHIVQGHVDGTATVRSREVTGDWEIVWFESPEVVRVMVPKGSVAVDGVSLTVCDVTDSAFSVMLIPHTSKVTTLGRRPVGSRVNIENDILGKYVLKLAEQMFSEGRLSLGSVPASRPSDDSSSQRVLP